MSTIFIPVEIPDDELVKILAKLTTAQPAQYAPNPGTAQPAHNEVPLPPEPTDPWADQGQSYQQPQPSISAPQAPAPTGQYPPQYASQGQAYQGAPQQPQAQPQGQPAPNMPQCQHGVRKFVAAGFSQRTGQPYPAFWACQAIRNDPTKCKSLPA
jgi:hypothetical protein